MKFLKKVSDEFYSYLDQEKKMLFTFSFGCIGVNKYGRAWDLVLNYCGSEQKIATFTEKDDGRHVEKTTYGGSLWTSEKALQEADRMVENILNQDNKKKPVVVNLLDRSGEVPVVCTSFVLYVEESMNRDDILNAIRAASDDFCCSKGEKTLFECEQPFTFKDFASFVTNDNCRPYGIERHPRIFTMFEDADAPLVSANGGLDLQ